MSWFKPSPGDCTCICEGRTCADLLAIVSGVTVTMDAAAACGGCANFAQTVLFPTNCTRTVPSLTAQSTCCPDQELIFAGFFSANMTIQVEYNTFLGLYRVTVGISYPITILVGATFPPLEPCDTPFITSSANGWDQFTKNFQRTSTTISGLLGPLTLVSEFDSHNDGSGNLFPDPVYGDPCAGLFNVECI